VLVLSFSLVMAVPAMAATPVVLGSAANFAVLAGTTITSTGLTVVTGDLGVSPGSAVTGFGPGVLIGTQYTGVASAAGTAQADLTTAYNDAAGRAGGAALLANINGLTFTPGLYKQASSVDLTSGNVTLDAQGDANAIFIFQIGSTLITGTNTQVVLTNGARAANVFWQVGSSATLGTNSIFKGNVLAFTSITVTSGTTVEGRVLAINGAVTLDTNTITKPASGAVPDTTAPTVSSTVPANAAMGVAINSAITATFSEAMDPLTITTVTFTLKQGTTPVAGAVTYAGVIATFTPAANLAASTNYTATITTGAKDLAGNALAANKVWSFTTSTTPTNFESFALGGVNGQGGWTSGSFDVAVVSNNYGYPSFGARSLRISNAITSGSFGDQTFSKSLVNEAGETSADTSAYSGGTRQPYFEAQWDFASTVPGSEQPGLSVAASPDRGDGARMSWVQMQDTPSGLQLNFYDYQRSVSNFVLTPIATGLDRTVPHTVKITMQFIDGPSNDIVNVYLDGVFIHTGTSWEDYARDTGGAPNTVDSIMFRVSGTAIPANSGKGFLIDNFSSFSGPVPLDTTAPTVTTITPANAAVGVSVSANISVNFSEAMDISTISSSTFTLKQGTTPVSGNVTYAGVTATFTPLTTLAFSTTYTATITTGAKDLAGNALAANYSWSFTSARNYIAWSDQGIVYTASVGDAYYPSVIYDNNHFGLGLSSPTYKMWYSDGAGGAFLVTSSNGTSWSAPTTMNGLGGDTHHVQVLYDANRFGLGPLGPNYRIWYWDNNAQLYDISSIATAQSVDGVNWVNDTALSQDALARLVTGAGTGWNRGSYGPVNLFYQPSAANTGTDPWNYSYVMYYDGTDGGMEETGLAYSIDGLFWKAYSGNPVLAASPIPAWDSDDAAYGTVYHDFQGFHYWYSGGVSTPYDGIGYAFSTNGAIWVKNPNPIFRVSDGVSYRNKRVYTPSIIDDGTGFLKMYYTAQATVGPKKIGLAILTLDTTAPTVSSTIPANAATGVAINSAMTVTFSEAMDPLTVTTVTFTLQQGTTPVAGAVTYAGVTATFTPDVDLAASTNYTATITTGTKDLAGNALASNYVWSFTTGVAPDTTAPTVISTIPANAATGVVINSVITAIFSEAMDPLTVTTATFTLQQGTTPVAGMVTNVGVTATFMPVANLAPSTTYTATITTGAKDLAGNALASNYVWSFTINTPSGGGGGGGELPEGTTDVVGMVATSGRFTSTVTATSADELCTLTIPEDTVGLDKNLKPLTQINIVQMITLPAPPAESTVIGLTYNIGPDGATFDPPIIITFSYDPTKIPAGVDEQSLVIAFYEKATGQWITLSDILVDAVTHTISGKTSHFTTFTVAYTRATAFSASGLTISPVDIKVGESVSISVNIANIGDLVGSYDATLKINNMVVETKKVTLAGHSNRDVLFITSRDAAGSYTVSIDTLSGTFTVKEVPTPTTPAPTTPASTTPASTTPVPTTPATTTPTTTPTPTPVLTNWGLIGGLIAGAIVIIGLLVYFLWRKKRLA
jgi:hypothetical protein